MITAEILLGNTKIIDLIQSYALLIIDFLGLVILELDLL